MNETPDFSRSQLRRIAAQKQQTHYVGDSCYPDGHRSEIEHKGGPSGDFYRDTVTRQDLPPPELPLVVDAEGKGIGYDLEDIKTSLGPNMWQAFLDWFHGQTAMEYRGHTIVYPWDWQRFWQGKAPLD